MIPNPITETVTFQATVIEVTGNSILVEPIEGSSELSSSDQFSIPNKDGLELQTGNIIEIEYNGDILESHPVPLKKYILYHTLFYCIFQRTYINLKNE